MANDFFTRSLMPLKQIPPLCLAVVISWVLTFDVYAGQAQAARKTSDDTLQARVHAALISASDVPGREMTVAVSGGVVTLTGRVSTATEQQSVGAIVRAVPGVKDVRFQLRIEPPAKPAAPARP